MPGMANGADPLDVEGLSLPLQLRRAVREGDAGGVRRLMTHNPSLSTEGLLIEAAYHGHIEVSRWMMAWMMLALMRA